MQDQRTGAPQRGLPDPDSPEYEAEKLLLLELVVDPQEGGDPIDTLCAVLELPHGRIEAAADRLMAVGLVERREDRLLASEAARYFEHLWPTGL